MLSLPEFEILGVFTQPDRPKGRGKEVAASPVKEVAAGAGIAIYQPEKIRGAESEQQLRALNPDVIVIIAYGQIIPAKLLPIPRLGWINLHASLLPKYRGAAPIAWAIANGESVSGNTTMRIDAGMDTGEMLLQQELPIGTDETAPELASRLAEAGAGLMIDTLRGLQSGQLQSREQDSSLASYAPILKREDGRIDWTKPALEIYKRMRGFTPWPGAYTEFRGQTCHVWGRPLAKEVCTESPGTVMTSLKSVQRHESGGGDGSVRRDTLAAAQPGVTHEGVASGKVWVACGAATVMELTDVKVEGRKRISAAEFANGARLRVGERFGES
jgi:methionyl-tRNA formyltransferase